MKRILETLIVIFAITLGLAGARAEPITVTDVLGRQVTLEKPASRIVLGQGRHLLALGLIHPDPVSLIAGWKDDLRLDPATYETWKERFPAIEGITSVGAAGDMSFSIEKAISLQPDLVVFGSIVSTMGDASAVNHLTSRFEDAGIKVVFVDFFVKPMQNSLPSLEILGRLTGAEEKAAAFAEFYTRKMDRIASRITPELKRPDIFMQVHASGADCCNSPGQGVFHDFIEAAGGHNLGADVISGIAGKVSLEYLISTDPDFYVATGGAHMAARKGLVLGTGIDASAAAASLASLVASPGLADLTAVSEKRAYGVWHLFNDSPSHILMIEALARWFHPDLFGDVDPQATLAELNERFLAVPLSGTYWIGLE